MELINQILRTIINSFDIAFCLVVNLLTYIFTSSITTVIHKQITRILLANKSGELKQLPTFPLESFTPIF